MQKLSIKYLYTKLNKTSKKQKQKQKQEQKNPTLKSRPVGAIRWIGCLFVMP